MSLRKPIIKVTKICPKCKGKGWQGFAANATIFLKCKRCKSRGEIDIRKNDKNFKKYYIKNLEEIIEYWTTQYRNINNEAQDCLKKVREYSKELDKVINKRKN